MKTTKKSEEAALSFLNELDPQTNWKTLPWGVGPKKDVNILVRTAFFLYEQEWDDYDIRNWKWPFECLREGRFDGDEPWILCLRRAVQLLKECPKVTGAKKPLAQWAEMNERAKLALVYQGGIANVFRLDNFSTLPERRGQCARVLQSVFQEAVAFCQGAAEAGAKVKTYSCNQAGDVFGCIWNESLTDEPFFDKMVVVEAL